MDVLNISQTGLEDAAQKAATLLSEGKVLAAPTDTVYGLLADARNEQAVARVFEIKGRGKEKDLPIFVQGIGMAEELAEITEIQKEFLSRVWPGKVTAILQRRGGGSIGLRAPDYALVARILEIFGGPVTGTSANVSGRPSALDSKEVIEQFAEREPVPDLLLDVGKLPFSLPSTVVDIMGETPKVLRPGAVEIQ